MADIQLKVSPDVLKEKAGEIENKIANIERYWGNLCETVKTSKRYWEGEAGDCGRNMLEDMTEDVDKMLRRLKEHPKDLVEMAGIYISTEEQASRLAEILPKDVIS